MKSRTLPVAQRVAAVVCIDGGLFKAGSLVHSSRLLGSNKIGGQAYRPECGVKVNAGLAAVIA